MKKILILIVSMALTPIAIGATPTPSVTPTPTPAPTARPQGVDYPIGVDLIYNFDGAVTDQKIYDCKVHRLFTTPYDRYLYISNISWTCYSATDGRLYWNTAPNDDLGPPVHFIYPSQGSNPSVFIPPLISDTAGASPILTTTAGSKGTVWLHGELR